MLQPSLVVLAAGIGSRYGGLKQTDPVGPNGELILDYSVYDALRAGFERVVFVINRDIEEAFRERVGKTIENQCDTVYVFQQLDDVPAGFRVPSRQKPWGTAHATFACRNVVDRPFAVINADDFYGRSSYQALGDDLRQARDRDGFYDYCMVGFVLENTLTEHGHVSRGVCTVDEKGFLVEIRERTRVQRFGQTVKYSPDGKTWIEIQEGSIASLNAWGFTPSLFPELEARFSRFLQDSGPNLENAEFYLPVVVGDLVREGKARVRILPTEERWIGVTYQEDKPKVKQAVEELIRQDVYPENLWE
jgi:NDP-sugar pyrophosphorylase family protein